MKRALIISCLSLTLGACSHHTYVVSDNSDNAKGTSNVAVGYPKSSETKNTQRVRLPETGGGKVNFLPNATAFRMSGDYADNVAITLSPEGDLLYFPAPTDITADSAPVELADGWWLNNQGLGPNSVFTKYTFAEYASLPEVPSPQQLKLSIIPGARVTGFMELPMKIGEANQKIETAKTYVKNH